MNLASPLSTRLSSLTGMITPQNRRRSSHHDDGTSKEDETAINLDTLSSQPHSRLDPHDPPPIPPRLNSNFTKTSSLPATPAYSRANSNMPLIPSNESQFNAGAPPPPPPPSSSSKWAAFKSFLWQQAKYIGPGITMSVAYCDPGNWATDLQAGSQFGFPLLFVILLTGVFGIILQVLSLRLGIVRSKDLATSTREWCLTLGLNDHQKSQYLQSQHKQQQVPSTKWKRRSRFALLWLLYFVAEGAIVCTELAELVGSAIALNLLFPKLPLWAGVLITSLDVLLILFIYKPDTKSIRLFEFCIGCLVLVVISCLIALVIKVDPNWSDVFYGYVPSSTVTQPGPLYVAIGILGATVMPHGLFLGSHFSIFERDQGGAATIPDQHQDASGARTTTREKKKGLMRFREWLANTIPGVEREALGLGPLEESSAHGEQRTTEQEMATQEDEAEMEALSSKTRQDPSRMRRRILHSTIDVSISMVCFAVTTNSALLIVAAQAFYYGIGNDPGSHGSLVVGDLFEAFELIKTKLNHVFAILFAIALLAAGQSASITVTLAGQIISEGMIHWKTNAFVRRCITRLITVIPSLVVAVAVGKSGLDTLLVASQVALSMALPFVLLPLLLITNSKTWMTVGERDITPHEPSRPSWRNKIQSALTWSNLKQTLHRNWWTRSYGDTNSTTGRTYFASGWILVGITSAMYILIVICDLFVIVTTANGTGGDQ
ncbi:unnamed protein product [Sympodiomycopsis kandeliae]